jgi:hypothetical protein
VGFYSLPQHYYDFMQIFTYFATSTTICFYGTCFLTTAFGACFCTTDFLVGFAFFLD